MKSRQAVIALASAVALLPVAGASASTIEASTSTPAAAKATATTSTVSGSAARAGAAGTADATAPHIAPAAVATPHATVRTVRTTPAAHARTSTGPAAVHAPRHATAGAAATTSPASTRTTPPEPPAPAAPRPRNDSYHSATVARSLPATFGQDVAGATLDQLEAGLAQDCGLPTADRAVWFRYDDPQGAGFVVDASASDHPVAIALVSDPKQNVLMGCSRGSVLTASPGPTGPFYVAVLSDAAPGATSLSVRFRELSTAPAAEVSIDPTGALATDGSATLTGTYSCGSGASGTVSGSLIQGSVTGISLPADLTCDGSIHTWRLVVSGPSAFGAGPATATVDLSACSGASCSNPRTTATVTLTQG